MKCDSVIFRTQPRLSRTQKIFGRRDRARYAHGSATGFLVFNRRLLAERVLRNPVIAHGRRFCGERQATFALAGLPEVSESASHPRRRAGLRPLFFRPKTSCRRRPNAPTCRDHPEPRNRKKHDRETARYVSGMSTARSRHDRRTNSEDATWALSPLTASAG